MLRRMRPIVKSLSVSLSSKSDMRDSNEGPFPPETEKRMRHDRPGAWLKSYAYLKNSNDCPHLSCAYEYQFCGLRSHSLDDLPPVT